MRKGLIVLFSIAFSLLILIAERYFFSGIEIEKPLYVSYFITYLLYIVISLLLVKRFHQLNPYVIGLILLFPQIILLFLILFSIKERIPVIYPISTIMVFLGVLSGLLLTKMRYKAFLVFFLFSCASAFLYFKFISLSVIMDKAKSKVNEKDISAFGLNSLRAVDHRIDMNLFKDKVVFLEFWFKNCQPCVKKMEIIERVRKTFLGNQEILFCTVNAGNIDSYDTFLSITGTEIYKGFLNIYDSAGLFAKQNSIESFPTDLIINNGKILRVFNGWENSMQNEYISETQKLLSQQKIKE